MYSWRITKFDPSKRNSHGHYLTKDWTSVSDIGLVFNGKPLVAIEYKIVEDKYINAITSFMGDSGISKLKICGLEKHSNLDEIKRFYETYPSLCSEEVTSIFRQIHEGDEVGVKDIGHIGRLVLREHLWCKLECKLLMYGHFGYDYYMYIASHCECKEAIEIVTHSGLFIEPMTSPYIE